MVGALATSARPSTGWRAAASDLSRAAASLFFSPQSRWQSGARDELEFGPQPMKSPPARAQHSSARVVMRASVAARSRGGINLSSSPRTGSMKSSRLKLNCPTISELPAVQLSPWVSTWISTTTGEHAPQRTNTKGNHFIADFSAAAVVRRVCMSLHIRRIPAVLGAVVQSVALAESAPLEDRGE